METQHPPVPAAPAFGKGRAQAVIYSLAALAALAGLADATYLTVQALTGETLTCGGSPDCFRVLGSAYARMAGLPVAAIGAAAYFSAFALATFAGLGHGRARRLLPVLVAVMFIGTLWLLFVQAFVLHAYCRYCLFSAGTTFLLTGLVVPLSRNFSIGPASAGAGGNPANIRKLL